MIGNKGYTEIGKIIVYFSFMEWDYKTFFPTITGIDKQTSNILTAETNFGEILKNLRLIVKSKFKKETDKRDRLIKFIDEAKLLNDRRNEIIHGNWCKYDNTPDVFLHIRLRRDVDKIQLPIHKIFGYAMKNMTVDELQSLSKDIVEHSNELNRYIYSISPPEEE